MLRSAAQFIKDKGDPAAVALAIGHPHTAGAVAVWKHRNKIPRSAWPEIMVAFPEVTLDQLKQMEQQSEGVA